MPDWVRLRLAAKASSNSHQAQCGFNIVASKADLMIFNGFTGKLRFQTGQASVKLGFKRLNAVKAIGCNQLFVVAAIGNGGGGH